jgi:allantoicase
MGEGWETARRRDDGNDWVQVGLVGEARIRLIELDTSYFLHNAPGWASVRGRSGSTGEWHELLARTPLRPDTRHRFVMPETVDPVSEVRLDIYPDGGMARLRLYGALTPAGRADLDRRWAEAAPTDNSTGEPNRALLCVPIDNGPGAAHRYAEQSGEGTSG